MEKLTILHYTNEFGKESMPSHHSLSIEVFPPLLPMIRHLRKYWHQSEFNDERIQPIL
jgi:hypothetical protein